MPKKPKQIPNPFNKLSMPEKMQFLEAWKKGDPKARTFFDNYLRENKRHMVGDGQGLLRHKSSMSVIEDWLRREECRAVDGNAWNPDYAKFAHKELSGRGLTSKGLA